MIKKLVLASSLLLFASSAFSLNYFYDKDLSISKNSKIKIIKFENIAGGIFKGYVVGFDGEGPFYTRAEYLSKSIKSLDYKTAHKKPKNLMGKVFTLSSELETVISPPVEQIEKK